jgi:hypothetical protein
MGQYKALFWKNFLVWRRDTCCSCCQIVTTVVFALFLLMIKRLSNSSEVIKDDTYYLNNPTGDVQIPSGGFGTLTSDADFVSKYVPVVRTPGLFKDCNYTGPRSDMMKGGYVAVATKTDRMYTLLESLFTQVGFAIKRFPSKDAMMAKIDEASVRVDEDAKWGVRHDLLWN